MRLKCFQLPNSGNEILVFLILFISFKDLSTETVFKSGDSDKWNCRADLVLMPKIGFPKIIRNPIQVFGFFLGFHGY